MAELALSPLLQVVFDRLASPLLGKLRDLYDLKKNFEKLQYSLPMILAFLEDAEERQVADKAVKIWLNKLKNVAYDSDDLLDELAAEITLCEIRSNITRGNKVSGLLLPFKPSRRIFDVACELQEKLMVLDKITGEGLNLNFKKKGKDVHEFLARKRETVSFVVETEVYGREEDKKNILGMLLLTTCHGKTNGGISVIPIVGIGGLGKTTLAQLVYNDASLVGYFDLKIWVCVSNDFDAKKLIKAIIVSATRRVCEFSEMDMLQMLLRESLCSKRCLLVLDDIWNEDQEEWDRFRVLFTGCAEGSKMLVTTRSNEVAWMVGTTSSPYHLNVLSQDDCWDLFKNRAFGRGEEEKYPNLLPIGKQIIKKCGGVPLAAKTLGSLLRFKREEREWLFVQRSELYNLDKSQNGILPTLKLSYSHLPPHLKRCFAYCSLFPKNYEFKKEKLIRLWMAEGLIMGNGECRPLEDVGNDYFNALLWMSLFQEVKDSGDDSITVYKMHDLVHDLAQSVAGDEFLKLEFALPKGNLARVRHSSVVCKFESSAILSVMLKATRLRTLLLLSPGVNFQELPPSFITSFMYLRVLDLSGSGIKRLQISAGELMCLRYLDLSNTSIQELPDAICELFNLQMLYLSGCYHLVKLPDRISKLVNLRHLDITGCEGLTHMPNEIGRLVLLQTLPKYIVGEGSAQSLMELSCLDLQGELTISSLENVRNAKEAKNANLKEKHLHVLGLSWGNNEVALNTKSAGKKVPGLPCGSGGSDAGLEVDDILACLEPHPNLRKLFIKGFPGFKFPFWVLPNLVALALINCKRCESLPALGHLPFLETLYLQGMDNIKHISREFYGQDSQKLFPSLKELTLREFPNLEDWCGMDNTEVFPQLRKLILEKCPNLMAVPLFPSVQHVELQDCHPSIINSMENSTSLSNLVIHTFPGLLLLSEELLKNDGSLTSLKISSCQNLHSLPSELEKLTALKSLSISWCEELSCLPQGLQYLKSLESLEISECHGLFSLPDDGIAGLSSLKVLSIENCKNLTSLSTGLQYLNALEHLTIMYCPNLTFSPDNFHNLLSLKSFSILCCPGLVSLPEGLQHIKALHRLEIRSCSGLRNLPGWITNFSSLRSLAISDCHNLTSLPEGFRHLTTLQHLSIEDCPNLDQW
ncbi:putative disease resistance protein RGA3 [Ziziphus jujuba]|uniref:Disease resistance protein RGA3 n=1 Tax=Ziziphus jujuba TaxID=326968 RepID=A0A6P4ASP0_ZIZJJ|nr:putative disease resistance protein RGA3 [Ziziphus jujuba]